MSKINAKTIGVVFVAVFLPLLLAGVYYQHWLQERAAKIDASIQIMAARDRLQKYIKGFLSNPDSLDATFNSTSSPGNSMLSVCWKGAPKGVKDCASAEECCTATPTESDAEGTPFNLIDPNDQNGEKIFSGTPEKPARYDRLGRPCNNAGDTCPLEVYTHVKAQCQEGTDCLKASQVTIHYMIRLAPNLTLPSGASMKPAEGEVPWM